LGKVRAVRLDTQQLNAATRNLGCDLQRDFGRFRAIEGNQDTIQHERLRSVYAVCPGLAGVVRQRDCTPGGWRMLLGYRYQDDRSWGFANELLSQAAESEARGPMTSMASQDDHVARLQCLQNDGKRRADAHVLRDTHTILKELCR